MLALLLGVLLALGCGGDGPGTAGLSSNSSAGAGGVRESDRNLDLGEDWDDSWIRELSAAGSKSGSASAGGPGPIGGRRSAYWGIVLGTYTHAEHAKAASNMVTSCATIDPRLGAAHVHTSAKGSTVIYGVYESSDDPAAQRDLKWIKDLEIQSRQIFPRAMLSRIAVGGSRHSGDPYALASLRKRYPNVRPLYTLAVAVWGDFGSGALSPEEIRRRGAAYARELRGRQFESYYHVDEARNLSTVTVGAFGRDALDPQSGLYAPAVEALLQAFPAYLVNGEPLNEPIDPHRPELGTRVQKPRLVVVPE